VAEAGLDKVGSGGSAFAIGAVTGSALSAVVSGSCGAVGWGVERVGESGDAVAHTLLGVEEGEGRESEEEESDSPHGWLPSVSVFFAWWREASRWRKSELAARW
jgi:hypothetical protein